MTVVRSNEQTYFDAFFHTVKLACAIILTDECNDGNAEGAGDHPIDSVDLCEGCMSRNRFRTQTVQGCLDDDIGDTIHD